MRLLVGGLDVSTFDDNGEQYHIHLQAEENYRNNREGLNLLTAPSTRAGPVAITNLPTLGNTDSPSQINRLNRRRQVTITANNAPGVGETGILDGIPAAMLERRPDIAPAERLVAARNAGIGVATAAYFPAIKLTANGGYLSKDADTLFSGDSRVWGLGPSVSLPLTGWAAFRFNVQRQEAARAEAVANYRQAVLTAVRDVETSLAQTRYLREQADAVGEALTASTKATDLIRAAYERGSLSYLELMDAERTRLQAELQTARVAAPRHLSTVRLIKALGGGW